MDNVPEEKWGNLPEPLSTSMKWQIGHLIVSQHYHGILVLVGPQKELLDQVPLKRYNQFFVFGDRIGEVDGTFSVAELKMNLRLVQQKAAAVLEALPDETLREPLFPRPVPHPVATNKVEALSWNIKHTMWHGGQIGILSRLLGHPFDFKLREMIGRSSERPTG